jgi:hypothetical protein
MDRGGNTNDIHEVGCIRPTIGGALLLQGRQRTLDTAKLKRSDNLRATGKRIFHEIYFIVGSRREALHIKDVNETADRARVVAEINRFHCDRFGLGVATKVIFVDNVNMGFAKQDTQVRQVTRLTSDTVVWTGFGRR